VSIQKLRRLIAKAREEIGSYFHFRVEKVEQSSVFFAIIKSEKLTTRYYLLAVCLDVAKRKRFANVVIKPNKLWTTLSLSEKLAVEMRNSQSLLEFIEVHFRNNVCIFRQKLLLSTTFQNSSIKDYAGLYELQLTKKYFPESFTLCVSSIQSSESSF